MAKKVSKNAKVAQRVQSSGSGKDFVKVIRSIKNPETGKYSYKELMIHKDNVKDFFANNK